MHSSPTVLKDRAAALELRKRPEEALQLYRQLLEEYSGTEHVDVTVWNRVGDLHLRLNQTAEAIALFELSADAYAGSGFLSNAIAICNKILRHVPTHVATLRRLARFSAEKGMVVDAQRYYLTVAEALDAQGRFDEAQLALKEFAELSPDDPHVRSVVVAHLVRSGRSRDALPHLTVLHRLHVAADRHADAATVARTAMEIDERWVPGTVAAPEEKLSDLPFLSLDGDDDGFILSDDAGRRAEQANRRGRNDRRGGDRRKSPRRTDPAHDGHTNVVL